jgi:hypothetical protein
MKAVCVGDITRCAIGDNLMAKALEMNLKITLINTIGRNYLMESAPGTLGKR